MITKNQVYDKLATYIGTDAYCTQYYEIVPKSLPCVYFRCSSSKIKGNLTLDMTDKQKRMYAYIEVYGQNIDSIVEKVSTKMNAMKFIEEMNEMIPNYDPSIERVSMRFQRVITDSDRL